MARFYQWTEVASQELVSLAQSSRKNGAVAGRIYEMVGQLTALRFSRMDRLQHAEFDIRFWTEGRWTVFILKGAGHWVVIAVAESDSVAKFAAAKAQAKRRAEAL